MRILINHDPRKPRHQTEWTTGWEKYCIKHHLDYEILDLMQDHAIETLQRFDLVLWHFGNYSYEEMLEARSILTAASILGKKVFPNQNEFWHFDDKIAEMYALQAINAPIPKSHVFYNMADLKNSLSKGVIEFPIVAKLRTGSGSHNVKLLHSKGALLQYARRMFSKGFKPAPSILYKTTSNIRSSHDWATVKAKAKRIPEFLRTLAGAKKFPREKGYVYLQEYIPNDNFDMKVVILGDKCTGFHRPVRSHDFRASGGGSFVDDTSVFTEQIIKSAFAAADALGMRCVGFDYVIDKRTGLGKIIEMSYGCGHDISGSGGYFNRECKWVPKPITIEDETIKMLIDEYQQ